MFYFVAAIAPVYANDSYASDRGIYLGFHWHHYEVWMLSYNFDFDPLTIPSTIQTGKLGEFF